MNFAFLRRRALALCAGAICITGAGAEFARADVGAGLLLRRPEVTGWITVPYGENIPMTRRDPVLLPAGAARAVTVAIDSRSLYQEIVGYGANLTESSVMNFLLLSDEGQEYVLNFLFGREPGAAFRFIRVPVGASDFSDSTLGNYTYCDTPGDMPDPEFRYFNMARDEKTIALLRRALAKNSELKIMLSPWSPPAWMKDNRHLFGGTLDPAHYVNYANYLVRTIREYEARGIPVHALSMQNEPGYGNDIYPSMWLGPEAQRDFIVQALGPALAESGLKTKLLILDHNWNMTDWADFVLSDERARAFVDGTAYHCYGGDVSDMAITMAAHPDKALYQTECTGWGNVNFWGDMHWWLDTHVIRANRMGTRSALGWNLILDEEGGPRNGGCWGCRGLVTVDRRALEVRFNPEFWALAHASRFLHAGARLARSEGGPTGLGHSAYRNEDGTIVLLVANPSGEPIVFDASVDSRAAFRYELPPGAAATIVVRP